AGGEDKPDPTVLTMANGNGDARELEPFAATVARLSGGTLRVEFENASNAGTRDYERRIIAGVKAGTTALGWVGSRAFDDVGVSSLEALHAPLLIDSYSLQRRALASPLAKRMLDGLDDAGVVGLGILPGPLRKPLGVARLRRPADYAGKTIAFQGSGVTRQTLHALGARGAQIPSAGRIDAYDGVEQQIGSIASNRYDEEARYLTANVTLWPRPLVVFANPKAFDALTPTQQSARRRAAGAASAATLAVVRTDEREALGILCRRGTRFVTAGDADLAALRSAVQPVYDRLERDPATKAAITWIRALRSELSAQPHAPASCPASAPQTAPSAKATPIDGVYRSDVTVEQLENTRGYESGESDHPGNVGQFRMELRNGHFKVTGSSDGVDQEGAYSVKGDVLTFEWNNEGSFSYRWSLYRGLLTLRKMGPGPTIFAVHPWRRTGDAKPAAGRTPIDGVYRIKTTASDLRAIDSEDVVPENYGSWTWVLDRGRFTYTQRNGQARENASGSYTVAGAIFTLTIQRASGVYPTGAAAKPGEQFAYRWSRYRDQLTLGPVKGKISPDVHRVKPWRRISDAP
ncbi:MAG TPA: TRAP transporter substrate-binding protein DctP, partial [Solirubrobacteraceae bacterium]|nr:TRAP transporter substrate-binding protein DctP [Solirubrobacteraceae bacterium]